MTNTRSLHLAGWFFIMGAILINIPYTLLIMNFNYPDILTQPPAEILMAFQQGGDYGNRDLLIWNWFAFAWVGFPVLIAVFILGGFLEQERPSWLAKSATWLGVFAVIFQLIGLLCWVFVVPHLAALYTDPTSTEATQSATLAVFTAVHSFGGNLLGEHLGQVFTVLWMVATSILLLKSPTFKPWVGGLGWVAGGIYLLGQTELLGL